MAAGTGNKALVDLLLAVSGIQVDIQDNQGRTALYFACINSNPGITYALLNSGADPTIYENTYQWTPLHLASALGNDRDVQALIYDDRADFNAIDNEGNTPIMVAIKNSQLTTMSAVVYSGVTLNTQLSNGRTALHLAVEYHSPAAITTLMTNGIDDTIKDSTGNTALHLAVGSGLTAASFTIISLTARANIDILDGSGRSALHLAVENNNEVVTSALLRKGAQANLRNSVGLTPLIIATGNQLTAQMGALLNGGANANLPIATTGWAPLHIAAGLGYNLPAKILLAKTATNKDLKELTGGYTPLHIAAGNNRASIVSALLAKGASTTILDDNGHTAKQEAADLGYTNIVNLFP